MSARGRSIAGGALRGLGAALVGRDMRERDDAETRRLESRDDAETQRREKREDVLELQKSAAERAAAIRDRIFQNADRADARNDELTDRREDRANELEDRKDQRRYEGGQLVDVIPDENGQAQGFRRDGSVTGLGMRLAPTGSRSGNGADTSGITAGEQRVIDGVVAKNTTPASGLNGQEVVDWEAVYDDLKRSDYPELAKLYEPRGGGKSTAIDTTSDQYREAETRADAWIDAQAGWFSRDSSDFKEFGGNREEARNAKIMEFYEQLTGNQGRGEQRRPQPSGPAPAAETSTSPPDGSVAGAGAGPKPQGSGTQADPYRATDQSAVDWFKQNAPAGAIIEVDGQLYQK